MVDVGADRVWVEDSGGQGPVVVLLHPGIADSRVWDGVWSQLTRSCRAIRFDVRGYGRSPLATEPYTIVGDILAVMDHLGVDRAHLVGCSMGGAAAMDLAVLHPDRVSSLVLLCPGVHGYPWPDEPDIDAEYERLEAAGDEEGLLQLSLREWAAAGHEPYVVDLVRAAMRAGPNEEAFQRRVEPSYDRLGELRLPAVLMVGDRDRASLIAADMAVAERIRGCRLVTMPGVDHLPSVRVPDLVARTILEQVAT
jgi:3-oxoadipate enol-lactonase